MARAHKKRNTMRGAATLNLLLGGLIFVTPWISQGTNAAGWMLWSNILSGAAIAVLALTTMGAAASRTGGAMGSGALNVLIGAWVFISAFVFNVGTAYFVLNIVTGGAVVLIGAYNAFAGATTSRGILRA